MRSGMTGRSAASSERQQLITADELVDLVELYEECEYALTSARSGLRERVSGSRAVGIILREEAVTARADLLRVLASWAGTVAQERRIPSPRQRDVRALVGFLADAGNLDWLLSRPAAHDFAAEITEVAVAARRAAHPEPVLRTALGRCLRPSCESTVHSEPAGPQDTGRHRVRCESGHDVPPHQWLRLVGAGRAAAGAAADAWLPGAKAVA